MVVAAGEAFVHTEMLRSLWLAAALLQVLVCCKKAGALQKGLIASTWGLLAKVRVRVLQQQRCSDPHVSSEELLCYFDLSDLCCRLEWVEQRTLKARSQCRPPLSPPEPSPGPPGTVKLHPFIHSFMHSIVQVPQRVVAPQRCYALEAVRLASCSLSKAV